MLEPSVLFLEIEMRERVSQHHENAVGIERLLQNFVRARLGRLDGGADGGVPADHHHNGRRIELAQLLERLHPIHAGHLHIEKNQVRPPLLVFGYPVRGVCEGVDLVPLVLQCRADSLLIIYDENPATHFTLL